MSINFDVVGVRPQARIDATVLHEWNLANGATWVTFYRFDTSYLLRFPDLADFHLSRDAREVQCWAAPSTSDETVRHLYLNQVLPLALSKQGKLVFHASAVEIGAEALAFMGESGRGKSTLAASFATSGFRFLTDDGLVIESTDEVFHAMPSHPSIRLWDDSQNALVGTGVRTAPAVQFTSKARLLAGEEIAFCDQPRVLRGVYFLGEGAAEEPVFERVSPSEALVELVKHSFLLGVEEPELLAAHFEKLTKLVSGQACFRLDYSRCFADLALVRQAIVEHSLEAF